MTDSSVQGEAVRSRATRVKQRIADGWAASRRATTNVLQVPRIEGLPTGRHLDLPGRGQTFITESGPEGAPVVFLLHSVSTTGLLCWYPVIPELQRDYRVITIDHRWHGRGIQSGDFSLEDCADDVIAVADQLGIDTFTAAGFSMGGGIAQLAWRRRPHRVTGLVLCSTGPYFSSIDPARLAAEQRIGRVLQYVDRVLPSPSDARLDDTSRHPMLWGIAQVTSTPLGHQGEFSAAMADFDSRPWLGEIDVPAAVVISTRDKIVQPERQQLLVDGIPGARRFDVDGGHACCVIGAHEFVPPFLSAVHSVARASSLA